MTDASRFQTLIEKSSDVIVLSESDSTILYTSPAIVPLLGYGPDELVGRRLVELAHPDDASLIAERRRVLLASSLLVTVTLARLRHRDGSWRWIESTARNLLDDPALRAVISNLRDVTDRQRELETQARLAAIVESSDDAIISKDLGGIINTWNRGAERLFGWSAAEMIGRSVALLIPPELQGEDQRILERITRGEVVDHYDTRRLRKDGSLVDVELTVSPLRDSAGRIIGASKVGHDLSERRKAEAKLRRTEEQFHQSQKMEAIGILAGGVAHDFNNLLSVILSYTGMAIEDLKPGDPLRADLEEVSRAGERGKDLTTQLLAFSRLQVVEPRVLDLGEVVAGMEKMLRRLLREDTELSLAIAPSLDRVHADAGQVQQLVMNLVVNARDAMPQGGKLRVEVFNASLDAPALADHSALTPVRFVVVAVTDTGAGMTAEVQKRIFEPFFTTKEKGKGTGLGLSTVFGIVTQSRGHIQVESAPGRGSTFRCYFPSTDQAMAPQALPQPPTTLRGNEVILLVEDDAQVRNTMQSILQRHGYTVLDAQNAGEAFMICEQHRAEIQLLISDIVMPRMNGRELAKRLAPTQPAMKTLFVSGYAEPSSVDPGAQGIPVLPKPITPDALLRRVREVLGLGR